MSAFLLIRYVNTRVSLTLELFFLLDLLVESFMQSFVRIPSLFLSPFLFFVFFLFFFSSISLELFRGVTLFGPWTLATESSSSRGTMTVCVHFNDTADSLLKSSKKRDNVRRIRKRGHDYARPGLVPR